MSQNLMKKFQVIGQCAKMQTLSLEDELRLLDGVPYDINFSQEASIEISAGATLRDVPVSSIVAAIFSPPEVPALPAAAPPDWNWEKIDKQIKKEERKKRRHAERWREQHPKRSSKEASKYLDKLMKKWGVD